MMPDVDYVSEDGSRPMREVIEERKRKAAESPRVQREESFRLRAGLIARLQVCLCTYPLAVFSTRSNHAEWCPSEAFLQSQLRVEERVAQLADDAPPWGA